MDIKVFDHPDDVDRYACHLLKTQINKKPDSSICFAGGNTTRPLHELIVKTFQNDPGVLSQADAFALDEYWGVPPENPHGVAGRLKSQILDQLPFQNVFLIDSLAADPDQACKQYDDIWFERGIDLEYLGLGENGHLGFNEPGTSFDSLSHKVALSQETRISKAAIFGSEEKVPYFGITVGLKNIMAAKQIVLLVKGRAKRSIVKKLVEGERNESLPASVLKTHPNILLLLDQEAASLLNEERP